MYDDNAFYVETMNPDGKTNLTLKQALEVTMELHNNEDLKSFKDFIKLGNLKPKLYTYLGSMEYVGQNYPLSSQYIFLRDSKLHNT